MNKQALASKKFEEMLDVMFKAGLNPLDYMLSYVAGIMCSRELEDYRAEFEWFTLNINMTTNEKYEEAKNVKTR